MVYESKVYPPIVHPPVVYPPKVYLVVFSLKSSTMSLESGFGFNGVPAYDDTPDWAWNPS